MTTDLIVSIRRVRFFNPIDWFRLLWWGLVTPDRLKLHQKQHGKDAHKSTAGLLISTLLWLPMFIVMSASALDSNLIQAPTILPTMPFILVVLIFLTWLVTWGLITWLKKDANEMSYSWNNLFPFMVAMMSSYIALEGMLGRRVGVMLFLVTAVVIIATCDVISTHLQANSEGILVLGLFTGVFFWLISTLLGGAFGIPLLAMRYREIDPIGLVIFVVAVAIGFICNGLIVVSIEWFVEKVRVGGLVMAVTILLLLALLIWMYYLGGWRVFTPMSW